MNKNMKKAMAFAQVNTKMKLTEIAKKFGVPVQSLYAARSYDKKKANKKVTKETWGTAVVTTSPKPVLGVPYEQQVKRVIEARNAVIADPVNHPAHYKAGGIETIDFIEAKGLNYNLGNVVKYITRAKLKGNMMQDLQEAAWYLNREIDTLKGVK